MIHHDNPGGRVDGAIRAAYSARSREYIDVLGSMDATHPSARALVRSWAATLEGPVLDAGCGPGQWTNFLTECGLAASGIDLVPEFVARARAQHPEIRFEDGSFEALDAATDSLGGVLSWYSTIHRDRDGLHTVLNEFARVLRPDGGLLVGFFVGDSFGPFDHAATTAYRWPATDLGRALRTAGFDVIETHTRTGLGYRPHGAIVARRQGN